MVTQKQRAAARRNVKKAQSGARSKQTLKNLPSRTRSALGTEAGKVRRGEEPTRKDLEAQARKLDIKGRSKMGKAELKRAVSRAKG
jgi:hypothetical protein